MENAALMVLHLLTAYILELLSTFCFILNNEHVPSLFSETNPSHHTTLQEKLAGGTSDQAQEASAGHQTTATAPPPSARVVKNFLSMMDVEGPSRGGGSRRTEHGAPRLRQLLSSGGPLAADAVAAS
jgi:hypothetical protein